jgi:hypothetical protein
MNSKEKITIKEFEKTDFASLLKMGLKLWTGFDESKPEGLLRQTTKSLNTKIHIAFNLAKRMLGFRSSQLEQIMLRELINHQRIYPTRRRMEQRKWMHSAWF